MTFDMRSVAIGRANDANDAWETDTPLFEYTGPPIIELDCAFEQAGRPVIVAERATGPGGAPEIWIYWFKPAAGDFVFEKFDSGRTPRCVLDNPLDTSDSDVMVFYIKGNNLVYRVQREDYAIVHSTPVVTASNMFVEETYRGSDRLVVVLSVRDVSTGTYSLLFLESTLYPAFAGPSDGQTNIAPISGFFNFGQLIDLETNDLQTALAILSGSMGGSMLHTLFDIDEDKIDLAIQSGLFNLATLHTLFDVDEDKVDLAIQSGNFVLAILHTLFDVDEDTANMTIQSGILA